MPTPAKRVTDLDVVQAHPITVGDFDVNTCVIVDFLNLFLSKPIFKNKIKLMNGYEKTTKRKLIFTYNNGRQVDVGVVTIKVKKQQKMKDKKFMISFNPSGMVVDRVKEFISENTSKNLETLESYRKMRKAHTNKDRLMAIVTSHGKQQFITADSREDFKRLASKDRTLSYKIVSEKFGYDFSNDTEKSIKKKYPKCKIKKLHKIIEKFWQHNSYNYKKVAKVLTGKEHTKNSDKIFAKRLLSRICGDRIWSDQ